MTSPFVRIVVVHHDSHAAALRCLRALSRTDWDRFEIVLVDNGSDGTVADVVATELPAIRVLHSAENLGFAGGNNLALHDLDDVDLVALVNDDVTVEPGWLRPLVDALDADAGLGAAGPKILLEDRYSALTIETPVTTAGGGDRRPLGVHLSGARIDGESIWSRVRLRGGWWGPEPLAGAETWGEWSASRADLLVPVLPTTSSSRRVELALTAASERKIALRSGSASTTVVVGTTPTWYEVSLSGEPFDVINNTGTVLVDQAYAADRGYLETDHAQFDREEDVFAWCGAAVVLRTEYLRDVGLFDDALFLYCEDLDLAWRGLEHGWRHRYVPSSVVRHLHGASAGRLPTARLALLKQRNHLIVTTRHARPRVIRRALAGFLLATLGYTRRDVIAPLARGERARPTIPVTRARAFAAFTRTLPEILRERRNR